MALSEERVKELNKAVIEASETVKYLEKAEQALTKGSIDQSWHILLTYLSVENLNMHTENLVKQSKKLKLWTIVIAVTAVGMIGLAIVQLIVLLQS